MTMVCPSKPVLSTRWYKIMTLGKAETMQPAVTLARCAVFAS